MTNAPTIADEFEIKPGLNAKNRFFKSAMSEQLGDTNHNPTPELETLYRAWARGGSAILVTGNVMIDRSALGEPKNVVLDTQSDLAAFKRWAKASQEEGTQAWVQLNHPGKQIPKFLSSEPVAPSAIALEGMEATFNKPRALSENEIQGIITAFGTSARLAKEAGFDGVQIHGAHGYLVSQFLSPRHNQRTDHWGGSLDNRMRFALAVYEEIRKQVGADFGVGIKLNSADYAKGGFSHEDSMTVVERLSQAGIDLIEVSGGTYESPSMIGYKVKESTLKREAYFLEYAEDIRKRISTPLVVTGGFRSTQGMNEALQSGDTDMIGIARPLAVYPNLPKQFMADPDFKIRLKRPSTGSKMMDKMAMLDLTWYEYHLYRLGKGQKPKANLSAWASVAQTFGRMGVHAFKKRRA